MMSFAGSEVTQNAPKRGSFIASRRVVSYRVESCRVVSCHIISYRIVSRHVVSCLILSCHGDNVGMGWGGNFIESLVPTKTDDDGEDDSFLQITTTIVAAVLRLACEIRYGRYTVKSRVNELWHFKVHVLDMRKMVGY